MNAYNFKTYSELFLHISNNYDNEYFLNYLSNGKYTNISTSDFKNKVICLSLALKDLGIQKGDKVGIFAKSSPFWLIFDFAILQVGAISVPIFANISSENLNFEIKDSSMKFMFIDSQERLNDIEKENSHLTFITHNFCIKEPNFYNFDEILVIGKQICDSSGFTSFEALEDDIFSIIYTSGNTGTPKGVMLTHKNIVSQLHDINSLINLEQHEVSLSVLPLAHIFERTVMSYYLSRGISIYFVDDVLNVANLMKVVRPTIMTVVPRLLEKIFNKIKLNISTKPFISRAIASFAFAYALKEDINKNSLLFKIYDKLVYSKFREIFGSKLEKLISGGAPLSKEIAQFFVNINVPVYQGYGLTEFSPVISTNYPNANKVGSCGKVIPSAQIKINENSELFVKGPALMKGYLNQGELTAKTIDKDGWLHTGDVAFLDEEGYLFIKSRTKEIFKTSTGEYVNAVEIEQKLSKNKYIEFAVIISENRKYTSALLFVDKEKYENAKKLNKNLTIEEYYNKDDILKSISNHINRVNSNLNKWEKIVKFEILTNNISIETGELTPSMKICRAKIEEKYSNVINSMY
ncbi:long-chain acyl-CoA synthetase [Arcobacter venerupis]|uniref:Long-chain acyl-CoA synthetase n=1 Tax=Arcobacter venerupis TaxID=1054033 RepID=A0AAE7BAG9_9BACT|nr:long-chain fatty acid--CoA ligase [Arcobacter venerupis]QKF66769.1 long-chain acyl-CoA synthetase [Arcobacter venerupis]RWS49765.1 AMP-dependent synthetase [Arcobacter venerupis]